MKVLHLPSNVGSNIYYAVRCLKHIGVNAFGLILEGAVIQTADGLKVIHTHKASSTLERKWRRIIRAYYLLRWITWADVIHWHFDEKTLPFGLDIKLIKAMRKPAVVEWSGSDIRIPDVEFKDNPYYNQVFNGGYEYNKVESYKRSRRTQKRFKDAGFVPVFPIGMGQYLQKDIFSHYYPLNHRIMLSDFVPSYPAPQNNKPLLVHSPSAPVAKGTQYVLDAVEKLKRKYEFEFILIQNMSRDKALKVMQRADIFLDQFIIGSHGMAAVEAMAYGKPVLCYIKPSLCHEYPDDLPILNANPDNLTDVLDMILKDGKRRYEIGIQSRAYVEKYHDGVKLAHRLVNIYKECLASKKKQDKSN